MFQLAAITNYYRLCGLTIQIHFSQLRKLEVQEQNASMIGV